MAYTEIRATDRSRPQRSGLQPTAPNGVHGDFRDRSVAAPLKRPASGTRPRSRAAFPRPIGRGPIEASRRDGVAAPVPVVFPRPIGRGPIEAPRRLDRASMAQGHFRDRSVAAPLKHTLSGGRDRPRAGFPRPIGRGPIEAVRTMWLWTKPLEFPRPIGRRPIEAH